ncbi:hypothetical protein [Nocardioides sp. SYSU DS0651]|uniref:hypothetical protein n=1 Tax=Nocardioides sp. SYSU DS0651 TaxID=3415955 RepID=UPI003F4B0329
MSSYDDLGPELPHEQREHGDQHGQHDRHPDDRDHRPGWHPVNTGHLVMGLAFLGLTLVWALVVPGPLSLEDHRWLLPAPWLAAGAAGLLVTVVRARPRRSSRMSG